MDTIKRDLTRNLTVLFPEVYDEVRQAFDGTTSLFYCLERTSN
jgi:hypothetical protein